MLSTQVSRTIAFMIVSGATGAVRGLTLGDNPGDFGFGDRQVPVLLDAEIGDADVLDVFQAVPLKDLTGTINRTTCPRDRRATWLALAEALSPRSTGQARSR